MAVLALDLNSFFASIEQQDDPALRNRPVAVAPVQSETTCCIAASYPAKRFGVKTGTRIAEARKLCPDIVIVQARPPRYVAIHEQIKAVVEGLAPLLGPPPSIDEFMCELPAYAKDWDSAAVLGRRIKQAIVEEVGECLTSSVGIAPNRYLAKTASDMQKPDGLVVLKPEDLPQALHRLELRDLCGIGANMEKRLRAGGIDTVEQLCAASKLKLREVWGGIGGEDLWHDLRGGTGYVASTERRTIGHSHVLPPEMRNEAGAHAVIHRMLQKAAMRLRRLGLSTAAMQVGIRYHDRRKWQAEGRFGASSDSLALSHHLDALWSRQPRGKNIPKPLKVGVVLSELIEAEHVTGSLFDSDQPKPELNGMVDRINLKFGKNTLYFGAAHAAKDRAPMRIAFSRIPDAEVE
jgi:DNA polymerase-4